MRDSTERSVHRVEVERKVSGGRGGRELAVTVELACPELDFRRAVMSVLMEICRTFDAGALAGTTLFGLPSRRGCPELEMGGPFGPLKCRGGACCSRMSSSGKRENLKIIFTYRWRNSRESSIPTHFPIDQPK